MPPRLPGASCLLLLAVLHLGFAGERPPLLNRIRLQMTDNLARLPNYTCLQTIERMTRKPESRRFAFVDMVRLEVALVNGNELFSWPGAGKFEDIEIGDLVSGGAIGNGNFALHARSVFLSSAPEFRYLGLLNRGDTPLHAWSYRVDVRHSGYTLRVGQMEAIVGYHGTFWADPNTLDLVRLEVQADDIPGRLQLSAAGDAIEYQRVPIGGETFLLPRSSEMELVSALNHGASTNRTRFSSCRQYTGESVLSFTDPELNPAVAIPPPVEWFELPKGTPLEVSLETPIGFGTSAVGDPITAILRRDVKARGQKHGAALAAKGALLHGRITMLRSQALAQSDAYVVALHFFELESGNKRAKLSARLEDVSVAQSTISLSPLSRLSAGLRKQYPLPRLSLGVQGSVLFVVRESVKLPRGLRMVWRTELLPEDKS